MAYPIKTCVVCGDEFELRPGKPGFANRCYSCTADEEENRGESLDAGDKEQNAHRRAAIKDLLYRKDS